MFQDQLENAKKHFDEMQQGKGYQAIDASQIFVGPKAYQQMAASKEVDAVVIATPPYYHPQHLEAIVAGGKHVYLEKPVAVDVPGALKVIEIGKRAEGKLSLDVGFQIRDCPPFVELVKRIHNGAIGNIVCGEAHYLAGYIDRPAWPNASSSSARPRSRSSGTTRCATSSAWSFGSSTPTCSAAFAASAASTRTRGPTFRV